MSSSFKPLTRRLIGALALGLGLSLGVQAQQALPPGYKAEYKLSTVVGTAFPWGKGGEIWANMVRERTQGRINIKLYPGVSLVGGDQTREFTAIRQGVIDLAIGSSINWSPQVKELNLFSLPFLISDYAALDALTAEFHRLIDLAFQWLDRDHGIKQTRGTNDLLSDQGAAFGGDIKLLHRLRARRHAHGQGLLPRQQRRLPFFLANALALVGNVGRIAHHTVLHLELRRRGTDIQRLPHSGHELGKLQRAIVQRTGQTEAMLHQHRLA